MKLNLSQREQRVLIAAAVALVLILIYLGADTLFQAYNNLERKIAVKNEEMREVSHLRTQYLATHQELVDIESRLDRMEKGFSVLSFIEDLAKEENIRENIGSAKPKKIPLNESYDENLVEIQMDNIPLRKLVDFVYKIEHSGHLLKVKRLRIKRRYDNPSLLYVTLQVTTYTKKT